MPHSVEKLRWDLRISCQEIIDFIQGKSYADFLDDRLLQLALEREFEIIGEALSRLERLDAAGLAAKIPDYRKIIGFRNVLAHGYDVIDDAALWDFARRKVPMLLAQIEQY